MGLSAVHGNTPALLASQNWPTASPLALDSEATVADWWFVGLDQRPFMVNNEQWTTRVVGVHLDGSHTWIQLDFAEDGSSLLLQLTPWVGLREAINMIREAIMRGSGDEKGSRRPI